MGTGLRWGLSLPLASSGEQLRDQVELARAAENFGYQIVWAPEAYGSDAVSLLATIAARTSRIEIGSAVLQIPGRSPAMTAMTAAGIDTLSGGRFRLGLGVSGPQVSEGWHGVRFADPLGRTREYVQIVRLALSRRVVAVEGDHFVLPLPDGQGKPLVLALRPERPTIPIYLAAVGPRSVNLAAEIADGWLAIFFDAEAGGEQVASVRAAAGRPDFDIVVSAAVSLGDDAVTAGARVRGHAALYIGGMGSRKTNFYHQIACRMGFEAEADEVQRRFLARDYDGAAQAVPQEFLERTCLVGNEHDIRAGLHRLVAAGVTTVAVNPIGLPLAGQIETLGRLRDIAAAEGLAT